MEYVVKDDNTGMMDSWIHHTVANDISPIKSYLLHEWHPLSNKMPGRESFIPTSVKYRNNGFILRSLAINLISS
jgi:hypothetical protein